MSSSSRRRRRQRRRRNGEWWLRWKSVHSALLFAFREKNWNQGFRFLELIYQWARLRAGGKPTAPSRTPPPSASPRSIAISRLFLHGSITFLRSLLKNPSLTRCFCGVDFLCLESRTWTSPLSRPPATSNARPRSDTFKVRSFPALLSFFGPLAPKKGDFDRVQSYVLFFVSRVFCCCFGEFAADRCGLLRSHIF